MRPCLINMSKKLRLGYLLKNRQASGTHKRISIIGPALISMFKATDLAGRK